MKKPVYLVLIFSIIFFTISCTKKEESPNPNQPPSNQNPPPGSQNPPVGNQNPPNGGQNPPPGNGNNNTSALLKDAKKGTPFTTGTVDDFILADDGTSVILLAANNTTGKIYAIDIDDKDAAEAAANTVSSSVNNFSMQIAAKMGIGQHDLVLKNIEVNPLSKSIYVLAGSHQNTNNSLYKVTKAGNTIEEVKLDDVAYSEITFSTNSQNINDMTWGDETLFVSFSHSTSLKGEVATTEAPFENDATVKSRSTTVFKTNWGGGYFTNAPLETMTYAEVGGKKRLMGLTTCAPGYSFEADEINNGNGLLEVKEYYNLNGLTPLKVLTVQQSGKTYLIEIHEDGRLTRVGEVFIDGSVTNVNENAKYLIGFDGRVVDGLTDEEAKILAQSGSYSMIAKFSDTKLIVVGMTGAMEVLDI
jgi:hypothetical protein